jgi:hypothetical protein
MHIPRELSGEHPKATLDSSTALIAMRLCRYVVLLGFRLGALEEPTGLACEQSVYTWHNLKRAS